MTKTNESDAPNGGRVTKKGSKRPMTRAMKAHLRKRDALRGRFGTAYDPFNKVLDKYDPVGIADVAPNEYDLEVHAILGRVKELHSQADLRRMVIEVFDQYFAPDLGHIREVARPIAADLWPQIRPFTRHPGRGPHPKNWSNS